MGNRNVAVLSASMIGENAPEFRLEDYLLLLPPILIYDFVLQSYYKEQFFFGGLKYLYINQCVEKIGHGYVFSSVQFSSAVQSCPTLCNPMGCSTTGLPVH